MLSDILDLCIEKSDCNCLYLFKYDETTKTLTLSKWRILAGSHIREWSHDFYESELKSALELMENE